MMVELITKEARDKFLSGKLYLEEAVNLDKSLLKVYGIKRELKTAGAKE